jgi:hypothetical protein
MKEKMLFLNIYYFSISEEKERNKEVLYHFLYNTDYNEFKINSYVIELSLFTDYRNFRNDFIDLKKHRKLSKILEDFYNGNNKQFSVSRSELKEFVELSDSYRLTKEDNEKIIRGYLNYKEDYKEHLDILLDINKQI